MIVGLFPGQGSLRPGMGAPWMDHPSARVIDEVSAAAGVDVRALLTTAPLDELVRTDNAQLATFALSAAIADAVGARGVEFDLAIGHSLGEYTALCVAGILAQDQAAMLVRQRGLAMAEAASQAPGTMAAIIGTDEDVIATALDAFSDLVVANRNAPGQCVVAGPTEQIERLKAQARELGLRKVIQLEVGGAFHSPLMAPAARSLRGGLAAASWLPGRIPVVSNVDATAHDGGAPWPTILAEQLTAPVEFSRSISRLPVDDHAFVECGPGGVLAGLVGRIRKGSVTASVATPEDLERLEPFHG